MQNNSNKNVDKILQELEGQDTVHHNKNASIDEDVNAILASLGMSGDKSKTTAKSASTKTTQGAQNTPVQSASKTPQDDVKIYKHISTASVQNSDAANETSRAKIVSSAPLNAPVIQKDTETLELPTIKDFSALQAKRLAEIERATLERAVTRAQNEKSDGFSNVPGMKHRTDALRVDVDDHFRAFFSKTVANDGSSNGNTTQTDVPVQTEKKKGRKRRGAKAKNSPKISVVASSDGSITGANAVEEPYVPPVGTHGTLAGFSVLSQSTSSFGVPVSEQEKHAQQTNKPAVSSNTQKAKDLESLLNAQDDFNVHSANINGNAANNNANSQSHMGEHYTDSIVNPQNISDTFMQNSIDAESKAVSIDFSSGAPSNYSPKPTPIDFGANSQNFSSNSNGGNNAKIGEMAQNLQSDHNDFWNTGKKGSGAVFKEITVNMPITRTSTIGVDPDKFGMPPQDYEEAQDYNHITDAPAVMNELKNNKLSKLISVIISGVVFAVLFIMGTAASDVASTTFGALISPATYLIINLVLILMLGAVCVQSLKTGFLGIMGRPSTDTLTLFAFIGSLAQTITYLVLPNSFQFENVTLFAPITALLFLVTGVGKLLHTNSVIENFKRTSAGDDQNAAFIVNGRDLTKMVCAGLAEPSPILLVSRPTTLLRGFMKQSFASHRSDVNARKISIIIIMASIACAIITQLISGEVAKTISAFAAVLCIGAPLTATLVYAVPFLILQRTTKKVGAIIPGSGAVQSLGYCNTVLLRSEDLFHASGIKLHGIKPFAGRRIDTAMLFAASIVYYNSKTLQSTFMSLIDNKKSVLLPVTNSEVVAGFGFTATVDGQHVVFGNRAMMRRHNIEIPSLEYENKFTNGGKNSVVYMALNHRPYSIYILGYKGDLKTKKSLDSLIHAGFSIVIQSDDFNITSQKVSTLYRLPTNSVKVLSQSEQDMLSSQTEFMPESEGYMSHTGDCNSFVSGIKAAADTAHREKSANAVQIAAVLVTVVMLLLLSVFGVVSSLGLSVILMYQIAWSAVTLIPIFINNS